MLRDALRAAALRAARALVLPELLAACDAGRRTWPELLEVLGYLNGLEKRHLALGAERVAAVAERDALRLELAEHLEALEEVRARLAAEQRGAALLLAQREAQAAIAEAALKKLGEAGERAKAAAAHEQELINQINAAHVVLQGAGATPGKLAARVAELDRWRREAHRRAREAEERLRAAQLAAEGGR